MARPRKQGLDYFPLDVDIFQDKKIRILKAKYGVDGFAIYVYLLCEIYKNGYYIKADDDFICIIADDLKMSINKVKQVLNFLLERSLFDSTLFQSDKVLTSESIQRRFQLAVKERAKKTPVQVNGFWILEKEETETFIQVHSFLNNSNKNGSYSRKNENYSKEKSIKESKVKESKVKESIKGKTLLPKEREELIKEYGIELVDEYIRRTTQYKCCNYETIKRWIEEDQKKEKNKKRGFCNFSQRKYTEDQMKILERELLKRE